MKMTQDFEQKIKTALQEECGTICISDEVKQKIEEEISLSQEEKEMKHFGIKRVVLGVAAACLLVSGGVCASKTAGFRSSMNLLGFAEYASYDKLAEAEQKLGYEVDCVEQFANGYAYAGGNIHEVEALDEQGNTTYTMQQLALEYDKKGEPDISLYVEKPVETLEQGKEADAVRESGNKTLEYRVYTYKFVPADYELTEEDKANEARNDYFISYGSSEVEIKIYHTVTWYAEGIYYNLMGFDLNLSPEEMLDMAEEILSVQ